MYWLLQVTEDLFNKGTHSIVLRFVYQLLTPAKGPTHSHLSQQTFPAVRHQGGNIPAGILIKSTLIGILMAAGTILKTDSWQMT